MPQNNNSTKDKITRRAYELYLMRGCEHGRDMEDWVQATKELTDEFAGKSNGTTANQEAVVTCANLRSAWPE